jgi:hypothetical protein
MSIQIQLRRGTALQHNTFTGANAELTVDTTNYALRLHDGSTAGGIEILRKDLANLADSAILNSKLANSSVTINGQSVSLGGSATITATATNALTIGTGLSGSSYNGSSAVTIALSNTGVTAGSYGSATDIPVLTINAQGQITAATTASVASNLNIAGDTGTDAVALLTDTLTISGGTGLSSVVTNNNVTINLDNTTVTPGTYGTASAVPVITIDAQGRITSASTTAVAGVSGVSFDSATGVLTISTSAGTSYTPDLGIGTGDSPTFASLTTTGNLTVGGDLIVNGTTTTVNSTTITVDDKNIELGSVATPTNITADGGGITLKGATDKTLTWVNSTGAWTSSEDFNLLTGKVYKINGTTVLSDNQVLGKSLPTGDVVGSSDTQTLTNKTLSSPSLTGTLTAGGSAGTNGYYLQTTGSGVQWSNVNTDIDNWDRNLSFAQIGSGANYLPTSSYVYLKIFDQTISANSSFHFKIEFNAVQNGGNMWDASNYGEIYVDGYRTTAAPTINATYNPNDSENIQLNNANIIFTTSSAGQIQIWLYATIQYTSIYGKLINLSEPDAGSPFSLQQVDLSRNNNWTTTYINLGSVFNPEYRDVYAEDYYGNAVYTTILSPGSYLTLSTSSKYISLVDSAQIRLGTNTDSRIWYDGTNDTLDIELESTATSFNVTNNGSDLFVVNRSTGNASVTGDLHVGGDITTGSTTSSIFNTTATTVNAFGAATALSIGASSGTTTINNNTVITGNLTVNGTTTTVNSTTLAIDDKNIVLADTASPTDVSADGGGITLKGTTDKTFNWVDATDAWTSSENLDLLTGKVYQINGTTVLSSTQVLGKSLPTGDVVGSSDTQTLTNKTLGATTISGNLTPSVNATYDLGSSTYKFKDLYLSGSSIFLDATSIQTHASGITFTHSTNTTVLPVGGGSHTLVTETGTSTLTNKTLSSPTLTGTLTAGGGTGTNGQFLKSTGTGLQWATVTQVTYGLSAETVAGGANLRITGSDASTDDVKLAAGSNINITRTDANTITIESTASSSKFLVYKRGDVAPSSATPIVISSGQLTVYGRTQNIGVMV